MMKAIFLWAAIFAIPLSGHSAEFSKFQWGLHNTGEAQTIELDQVSNFKVQGRKAQDIHKSSTTKASKKILVAVLDTGMDFTHPSLQNVIHRNESECRALEKYKVCLKDKAKEECDKSWFDLKNPEVDQDHNGYPMDCSGWSVLGEVGPSGIRGTPEFGDDQGHGTHVSGIIAANSLGLDGVSNNVEILPVQVLGQKPSEPIKPLSTDISAPEAGKEQYLSSLGDLVARGVNYAIASGARVINFSLGWPETNDSQYLRDVIAEARARGVFIVAAAGNDSTRALLRPCAYPGVICVASHGPDGALSHFSNYGTGVDIAAPGTNILSTYPQNLRPIRFRDSQGFEYLHGTSQASPFVAGMIAEMLARGVPAEEIYPRLILGSRAAQTPLPLLTGALGNMSPDTASGNESALVEKKFLLGGLADLDASLAAQPQSFIVPSSKEKQEILWNRQDSQLQMKFKFHNLWKAVDMKQLSLKLSFLRADSRAVRPEIASWNFEPATATWSSLEEKTLIVNLRITDTDKASQSRIPSELDLVADLTLDENSKSVTRRLILESEILVPIGAQNLTDEEYQIIPLVLKDRVNFLNVDEKLDGLPRQDYIGRSADGPITQYILLRQGGQKQAYQEVQRIKVDVGEEGETLREQIVTRLPGGYALGLLFDRSDKEDQDSSLDIYLMNDSFQQLEKLQLTTKTSQLPTKMAWQSLQGHARPTWAGLGFDPAKRASLRNDWENSDSQETPEFRLYYFDLKGKLQALQKYQDYLITDILEPTAEQAKQGRVPVLLAKNTGTEQKSSFIYDFAVAEVVDGKFQNLKVINLSSQGFYRNLLDTRVDQVFSLDPNYSKGLGTFWFGEGVQKTQRVSLLIPNESFTNFKFLDKSLPALRGTVDSTLWVRAAFYSAQRAGVFALTNSELQYHDLLQKKVVSRSLERYTFWSDYVFTALQFPLVIADRFHPEVKIPALYNTEGSALSKGVKIKMPLYDSKTQDLIEIISPARLRFKSVKGCRPLDAPVFLEQSASFDYYCGDKIVRIPLRM